MTNPPPTEKRNRRSIGIDRMSTLEILTVINAEDALVAGAVAGVLGPIGLAVEEAVRVLKSGRRIFYIGAGTSGRLAAADAAECPPTFNSPKEWFTAVIAGGAQALVEAADLAEDDSRQAGRDLDADGFRTGDLVVGISASGRTPYTLAGLEHAARRGSPTVAVVCAPGSAMARVSEIVIAVEVGPEIIAGSTRMKAGTAQKLVLNMFSTATMIRMGMTYDNWMVNVRTTNGKLRARGLGLLEEILGIGRIEAEDLARRAGNELKTAVVMWRTKCSREEAEERLRDAAGHVRVALGEAEGSVWP